MTQFARETDAAVAGRIVLPCELNAARSCIAEFQADVAFFPEVFMDPITYFLAFARLGSVQAVTGTSRYDRCPEYGLFFVLQRR